MINFRKKRLNNKDILVVVVVVILLAGITLFGKSAPSTSSQSPITTVAIMAYAEKVVSACSEESYRPACYDREIPELMDYISMEDAFKVTRAVQDADSSYQYCHVLGHELSAREVRKDPSKWKEVVARVPSGMCSNGGIHGGFQEKFRAEYFTKEQVEKIKPDLKDICEARKNWTPTGLEQGSCYHALGHLTMYITNADLPHSIKLCEEIGLKSDGRDYRMLCFDGAFMQIFQPLEPEDFALVAGKQPTKETVGEFCDRFEGDKRASCMSERWPLFGEEIKKPEGLVKFCSANEPGYIDRCYNGMFYVLTAQFNFDTEKITDLCSGLPQDKVGQCFANAAGRMIETDYQNIDKSVALCSSAEQFDKENKCFDEMVVYSTFNFIPGSPEFFKLCNALPSPWNNRCLEES